MTWSLLRFAAIVALFAIVGATIGGFGLPLAEYYILSPVNLEYLSGWGLPRGGAHIVLAAPRPWHQRLASEIQIQIASVPLFAVLGLLTGLCIGLSVLIRGVCGGITFAGASGGLPGAPIFASTMPLGVPFPHAFEVQASFFVIFVINMALAAIVAQLVTRRWLANCPAENH
jgi:hypothetical protein